MGRAAIALISLIGYRYRLIYWSSPCFTGTAPEKIWHPMSVAYSLVLGQEPKVTGQLRVLVCQKQAP
jgi:hypothetical protein